MQRNKSVFQFVIILSGLILSSLSCSKSDKEEDCIAGGITYPNSYRFWTHVPISSVITIEMRSAGGSDVTPLYNKIKLYYNSAYDGWEPNPCTFDKEKEAVAYLGTGQTYTYKATGGGKEWTGTIHVPCVQDQCFNIQLK